MIAFGTSRRLWPSALLLTCSWFILSSLLLLFYSLALPWPICPRSVNLSGDEEQLGTLFQVTMCPMPQGQLFSCSTVCCLKSINGSPQAPFLSISYFNSSTTLVNFFFFLQFLISWCIIKNFTQRSKASKSCPEVQMLIAIIANSWLYNWLKACYEARSINCYSAVYWDIGNYCYHLKMSMKSSTHNK